MRGSSLCLQGGDVGSGYVPPVIRLINVTRGMQRLHAYECLTLTLLTVLRYRESLRVPVGRGPVALMLWDNLCSVEGKSAM